jgi:hypothetical protein
MVAVEADLHITAMQVEEAYIRVQHTSAVLDRDMMAVLVTTAGVVPTTAVAVAVPAAIPVSMEQVAAALVVLVALEP